MGCAAALGDKFFESFLHRADGEATGSEHLKNHLLFELGDVWLREWDSMIGTIGRHIGHVRIVGYPRAFWQVKTLRIPEKEEEWSLWVRARCFLLWIAHPTLDPYDQ